MKSLNIQHEAFPYHESKELLSLKVSYHLIHSTAVIKDNKFTHAMFIGGLNIPPFIYNNLYNVKSVIIATEDPHTSTPLLNNLDKIDHYFSNERIIGNDPKYKNVHYCPTAACPTECGRLPLDHLPEKYHSDILFLGALYPNRVKLLESLVPLVKRHKLNFKICGHVGYMDKKSPLWKYVFDARTIPHTETISYYNGAKIVLNILRDVKWNSHDNSLKNPLKGSPKAESLNPRAYEVPLCQGFMLMDDCRAEAREVFSEDEIGLFSDGESLVKAVRYFLIGKGKKLREQMAMKAYKKVAENHTYSHRMLYIKSILEKDL